MGKINNGFIDAEAIRMDNYKVTGTDIINALLLTSVIVQWVLIIAIFNKLNSVI